MSTPLETDEASGVPAQATDVFSKLPDELLLAVFMHVEFPNRFSRVNNRFHETATGTLNIARWLEYRYYKCETIWNALLHLGDRAKPVLEILFQRGADFPNWVLSELMGKAEDEPNGRVSIKRRDPPAKVFIHATTVVDLYDAWKWHVRLPSGMVNRVRGPQLGMQTRDDFRRILKNHQDVKEIADNNEKSDDNEINPRLVQHRQIFVNFLTTHGSPVHSRAWAKDIAVLILERKNDAEWLFETLERSVDFPALTMYSFFLPVFTAFLGWHSSTVYIWRHGDWGQRECRYAQEFNPAVVAYLLQRNEVGSYRHGYAALDVDPRKAMSQQVAVGALDPAVTWRRLLTAIDRLSHFEHMVIYLLCSYRGLRLMEESYAFETCFFRYIQAGDLSQAASNSAPAAVEMAPPREICPFFVKFKSQGEVDALWLVLHLKNKISTERGRDTAFIQSRITFDSMIHLLSYPWLSPAELGTALKLTTQRFKNGSFTTVMQRALDRIMRNAFCGMHLVKLAGKLNHPASIIERLLTPRTLDSILLYPEIDDRHSEDPLVAGLQGYRLDLPTRKASYSEMGPKDHLPLALGILEALKDRANPALKMLLGRARAKKLHQIIQSYEKAGVCDA